MERNNSLFQDFESVRMWAESVCLFSGTSMCGWRVGWRGLIWVEVMTDGRLSTPRHKRRAQVCLYSDFYNANVYKNLVSCLHSMLFSFSKACYYSWAGILMIIMLKHPYSNSSTLYSNTYQFYIYSLTASFSFLKKTIGFFFLCSIYLLS